MQHTTTQPRITAITSTRQTVFKKSIFVIALASLGGLTILAGVISLVSAIVLLSNASMPGLSSTLLTDAVLDMMIGVLILVSSRAFTQGKILAIWLFGGSMLLDSLYSLIRGYELHYIFMGFGLLLTWQMLQFRKEWETK
jgi:hypothetical protein